MAGVVGAAEGEAALVTVGGWRLVVDCWRLVVGGWRLAASRLALRIERSA